MPGTVNSNARRKVRCPKCTVCLTEPPIPIYQCPVCSTLLLAKGSPGDLKDELPPGNRGDAENIQQTLEGGRSELENGTAISEPSRSVESAQSIPVGRFEQENAPVVNRPSKKQGSQGTDFIVEEIKSLEQEDGSKQDNCTVPNDLSENQVLQGIEHVEKERTSFEGDRRPSHNPLVEGNASEDCGGLGMNFSLEIAEHVDNARQIRERWSQLEKDALLHETSKAPRPHGRQSTPDGLEGHDFEFEVTDNCDAFQDVKSCDIGRDTESIQQMLDRSGKDSERVQQTLEGLSEQENETVRCDSSQIQGQQGMDYMGKECVSLETEIGSKQKNATVINDPGGKQQQQGRGDINMEIESSQGDSEILLTSAVKGSLDDSHATCAENLLHESGVDGESIKQIPQQWSKLEKGALIEEPGKKQNDQEMEWVGKGCVKRERSECREFEVDVTDYRESSRQLANGHEEIDAESKGMLEPNRNSEIEGQDLELDATGNREIAQQTAELNQFTQVGGSNQEKATTVNGTGKTQGQLGLDYVEERCRSSEREGESEQGIASLINDSCKKQEQQGMYQMGKEAVTSGPSNEQSLWMDCMEKASAAPDGIVGQVLKFDGTGSCEAVHQLVSGHNGRGPESTRNTVEGGSKHNKDSDEWSQEENVAVINYPGEEQGQQGLDHMEKELKSLEERSKQEDVSPINKSSKTYEQQGVDCMEKEGRSFEGANELLHISPVEGNPNDLHNRLTWKFLHENCVDAESRLEMDAGVNETSKRERQQGIIYMEKECTTPTGNEWQDLDYDVTNVCENTRLIESIQKGKDAERIRQALEGVCKPDKKADIFQQTLEGGSKQENASVIDDTDREISQLGMAKMQKECKSFDGENMPRRTSLVAKESPDFISGSMKNLGHANCLGSGHVKPILEDSEIDKDSVMNERLQGLKHIEEESAVSDRLEDGALDYGLIDYGEAALQEASGHNEREYSEVLLHEDGTDKEDSFMMKESELDCGSPSNAEAETPNICESLAIPEDENPSIVHSLPHAHTGTDPEAAGGNQMTGEVSKRLRQELHGGDGVDCVLVDEDGKGNCREHGSASFLSHGMDMPRDSNLEASLRYDDVWTVKLGNSECFDMSLCDWQSLKASNPPEDWKEHCNDAGLVDERRVLNSNMVLVSASTGCEDAIYAPLEGENNMLKEGLLAADDMSVIHSEALSDLNNTGSSSAVLGTERTVHIERSTIPIRTVAMQKFLKRTEKEVTDQMQLQYQESEAKIYNAPYIEEYQPSTLLPKANQVNQLTKGKLGFSNQKKDSSNGPLSSGSNIRETNGKLDSPSWSVKMDMANHSMLREDVHSIKALNLNQTRENVEANLKKLAVAEGHTLSNVSLSHMFGSVQFPRSYQHLESKMAPSARPQMNDYLLAKHSENSLHQMPKAGESVDFCNTALSRNVKGTFVNESRVMNAVSAEPSDHMHSDQKEQNNNAWSQKYQADNGVMDKSSGYLLQGSADSIHSCPVWTSHENSCRFSSVEKYLSNPCGLSPLNVASRPYPFQAPPQALMSPATIHDHGFGHTAHHSVSPVCTLCIQQAHMQQPQSLHNTMQHHCVACFPQISSMAHQSVFKDGWESHQAHRLQLAAHDTSDRLCQTGLASPQSQRHTTSNVQSKPRPLIPRRHRHFPPLPRDGAAPYVLCQECYQLLKVPQYLPPNVGNTQKLRCGACRKVSKFSVSQQTNNCTLIGSSQSSITPWLAQSSTACKVHPETAIAHPHGHHSLFSTNDHGRRLLISKAAQSVESPRYQRVESPRHEVGGGRIAVGSGFGLHYEPVYNQMLHQTDSSARITSTPQSLDYMHHPRSNTGIMQAQEFSRSRSRDGQGDRLLNTSGANGRSYLSSFPPGVHGSSPLGNLSDLCVEEYQQERIALGGKKTSDGVYLHSSVNDQDVQAFESSNFRIDSFRKGFNKSKLNFSAATMQDSHRLQSTESVGNEPFGRNSMTWTEPSPQWHAVGPGHSRSSSKGGTVQLRKWSTAPGSPIMEQFDGESLDFSPRLWQRVSGNGIGSAPWSPGSASPLYDHSAYDASSDFDEMSYQKERDSSSMVHGPIAQDMSRRPKYFAGLLKKSFKEIGKGGQASNNPRKVMVNSKLISDAVVKKAEEKAGVISPGSYWYDYQAGFWGVTGGPCLGIIPPFIEELNFPLVEDCAGGRTGVLVNGRELHHKDLKLLAGRGLPTTPGKSYAIDILGNVVDNASGQQLGSLGKLAPTIEKKKYGHGMWQPSDVQSG